MKNLLLSTMLILTSVLIASIIPTEAEAKIYEDTIRLHILANSDTEADQALKLCIRDKLLTKYGQILSATETRDEALDEARALLPEISADVEAWIRELGYSYSVTATISEEWYDTRNYGEISLPSGVYTSLRIIIGSGAGQNWWCVMYPPLCLDMATESAPADDGLINYSKEEITLIKTKKYNVKFKILELAASAFTKNS